MCGTDGFSFYLLWRGVSSLCGNLGIYETDEILCQLFLEKGIEVSRSGPLYILRMSQVGSIFSLRLRVNVLDQKKAWFWWPNHEGERGLLGKVYENFGTLKDTTLSKGLSVFYPISASCRTLIIGDSQGGVLLSGMPDPKGRVSQISVKSTSPELVDFEVSTGRSGWILTKFKGSPEEGLDWLGRIIGKVQWHSLPASPITSKYLIQVGLIAPDYECLVPMDRGFMVLEDIAKKVKSHVGAGNWIHVFGYSHGHDLLYPDYSPSAFLGGEERLQEAIQAAHKQGQKVSFYINIRIADKSLVESDFDLSAAVYKDYRGEVTIEEFHDREFVVMNPLSKQWQNRILSEIQRLISLGADGFELNYRGRKALLTSIGEEWGSGVRHIINQVKLMGARVWFRGATDIYSGDWLEVTKEEILLSEDGHLQSGYMIGDFDPRLYMTLVPEQSFLIPQDRGTVPNTGDVHFMRNIQGPLGELFMYNDDYLEALEELLRAFDKNE